MVDELHKGRKDSHAARTAARAERARAEGRLPGKPGGVAKVCPTCKTRHRCGPCPPAAIEALVQARIAGGES